MPKAKPFVKWVGGKAQLIEQLKALLPTDFHAWHDATYIEPFVGGGAMLFYMLQRFPNIARATINDINPDLATAYQTIRDQPDQLIETLANLQNDYLPLPQKERKDYYLALRARYNGKGLTPVENTALLIFLNRTCFNGLYRVNRQGHYNVPHGRYLHPTICDPDTLRADSNLLQRVEILNADFEETIQHATERTLFYLDPPYRPLSSTSSFNDYAKEAFDDSEQERLQRFCDRLNAAGHRFMLSNSDGSAHNPQDTFLRDLYAAYPIQRVWATRSVNADPNKRGKLPEILVRNYDTQRPTPTPRPNLPLFAT